MSERRIAWLVGCILLVMFVAIPAWALAFGSEPEPGPHNAWEAERAWEATQEARVR